ncbi:DUF3169 family protein [Acetobacterium bakii]|uniref:DUF3169 domain-containing protein n=1 Tax=Acetobacterium bakii TaxID=52689 RepID=A0A0L6TY48_9FIRM|nr:DUF3169 family protein [Acetobacterium bakii]KNZ41199.1 hypothetical protein AKG39_12800 [Acetobacterium bakii]
MKKLNITLKFFVIMIISGIFGGILGGSLVMGEEVITGFFINLESFILKYNLIIQAVVLGIFALIILIIYFNVKKKLSDIKEDDEEYLDGLDRQLNFLLPFISVDMILSFFFFGISISNFTEEFNVWPLIIFIANIAFTLVLTTKSIKLTKLLYPEKKGNPLDFNFDKVWIESCDEAEKYVIYKASYKTYQLMNYMYSGAMVVSLLISIIINIGIYPYLVITVLWITQTLIYTFNAIKYQRGQLENAK